MSFPPWALPIILNSPSTKPVAYAACSLYQWSALTAQHFLFLGQAFCPVILRIYPRIRPILRLLVARTIWTTMSQYKAVTFYYGFAQH